MRSKNQCDSSSGSMVIRISTASMAHAYTLLFRKIHWKVWFSDQNYCHRKKGVIYCRFLRSLSACVPNVVRDLCQFLRVEDTILSWNHIVRICEFIELFHWTNKCQTCVRFDHIHSTTVFLTIFPLWILMIYLISK